MFVQAAAFTLLLAQLDRVLADRSLGLSLSGPSRVVDVDNFSVVANVTNTGDEPLQLYKTPRSILSTFPEDSFVVSTSNDGAVVPSFIGAKAKYSFDHDTNLLTLNPGDSFIVTHSLSSAYEFTAPGTYNINPSPEFTIYDPATQGPVSILAASPNTHTAKLSGSLVSTVIAKREAKLLDKRTFITDEGHLEKRYDHVGNCSPSELSDLSSAVQSSATYLTNAINYLKGSTPSGERFTWWFGKYNASRKSTVLDHYKRIQSSDPSTYTYVCCNRNVECECSGDPSDTTFAYVYSNQPYKVYLCNSFYDAPVTGTNSKAGTIIHEASHFDVNGGTEDVVYGPEDAHTLALQSPATAITNADSHEYFAENNPALS